MSGRERRCLPDTIDGGARGRGWRRGWHRVEDKGDVIVAVADGSDPPLVGSAWLWHYGAALARRGRRR
jgi:hypothetical protein